MVRQPRLWVVVIVVAVVGAVPPASAGVLTGVSISLADADAGATTTATVSFTTASGLAATDRIEVTFPVGFDVSGVGAADGSCSTMDGAFATSVVGQMVRITRSGGSAQGAAAESCTIANVVNPAYSGLTSTFTVETYTLVLAVYVLSDSGVAAAVTIDPAALTGGNVQPASLLAGATSTSTVTFTTANLLPSDGRIQVTFPAGFDVGGATGGTCAGMDGAFATSTSGQTVTLTRSGGTAEPAGAQSCTVAGIQNPTQSGSTGTYAVKTLTSLLAVIDQDLAVAADTILANALSGVDVQPASLLAGATSVATVGFTTTNPVPSDGRIRITFPSGFDLSGVGASDGVCSSMDGSFSTSVSGQVVTITRSAGSVEPAGVQACSVADVENPGVSGSAGAYAVTTLTSALAAIDQDLAVAADTILANALSGVNVQPADLTKSAVGTATATFTTVNPIPADGVVEVTFPAGFDLSAVGAADGSCSTMDGSFATSVSGQVVTITRSGGTAEPAGAQSCTIADVKNPADTGTTGNYAVKTLNSAVAAIDQALAVAGDVITVGGVVGAVATLGTSYAGRLSDITFTWTGTATIPNDGELTFTFPSGFLTDAATSATCTMDGTVAVTHTATTVVLTRQGDGTPDLAGVRSCTIRQVQVPGTAGATGDFSLEAATGSGVAQEGGAVPGVSVTPTSGGGGGGGGGAGGPDTAGDDGAGDGQTDPDAPADPQAPEDEEEQDKEVKDPAQDVSSIRLRTAGDANVTVHRYPAPDDAPDGFKPTEIYFEASLDGAGRLKEATIIIDLPAGVVPTQAVLLHGVGDGWEALPGTVSGGRLLASTTSFSPFWLVEDVQAPHDLGFSIDEAGLLHADWSENQGRAEARLWIDGQLVVLGEDAANLTYNVTGLEAGEHALMLLVTDPAGHHEEFEATLTSRGGEHSVRPATPIRLVPGLEVPLSGAALLGLAFALRRRL